MQPSNNEENNEKEDTVLTEVTKCFRTFSCSVLGRVCFFVCFHVSVFVFFRKYSYSTGQNLLPSETNFSLQIKNNKISKIEVTAHGKTYYIRYVHHLIKQLNPVLTEIAIHYLNLYD